ncbi:MAG: hypothetical protein D6765_13905, partial [Bacteroidetes bacterium]
EAALSHPLLPLPHCRADAFFCRIEARIEKKARMPLRFRLGSLDYVNQLEGKDPFTPSPTH